MQRIDQRLQRFGVLVPEVVLCQLAVARRITAAPAAWTGLRLKAITKLAYHLVGGRVEIGTLVVAMGGIEGGLRWAMP